MSRTYTAQRNHRPRVSPAARPPARLSPGRTEGARFRPHRLPPVVSPVETPVERKFRARTNFAFMARTGIARSYFRAARAGAALALPIIVGELIANSYGTKGKSTVDVLNDTGLPIFMSLDAQMTAQGWKPLPGRRPELSPTPQFLMTSRTAISTGTIAPPGYAGAWGIISDGLRPYPGTWGPQAGNRYTSFRTLIQRWANEGYSYTGWYIRNHGTKPGTFWTPAPGTVTVPASLVRPGYRPVPGVTPNPLVRPRYRTGRFRRVRYQDAPDIVLDIRPGQKPGVVVRPNPQRRPPTEGKKEVKHASRPVAKMLFWLWNNVKDWEDWADIIFDNMVPQNSAQKAEKAQAKKDGGLAQVRWIARNYQELGVDFKGMAWDFAQWWVTEHFYARVDNLNSTVSELLDNPIKLRESRAHGFDPKNPELMDSSEPIEELFKILKEVLDS